jgi:hypothetical protein
MVKKSIIAIALMCMLATVSYAEEVGGGDSYSAPGQYKLDTCLWPATITITYTPVEICRIPIRIKVGMFIEVYNCSKLKIVLEQVNCTGNQSFPCYKDCVSIKVRSNFDAILSLKLYKVGDYITGSMFGDNWKAYFTDGGAPANTWAITGDGNWNDVDICVEAWDVNIYKIDPCTTEDVGDVAILAIPAADPEFCDYCP